MAITLSARHAADEEARAEVDVLTSRLEKTAQLTKKIQASLTRLETSGRSVQEAIGPIHGNTQRLQVLGNNIDSILGAIETVRGPSDIKNNEEEIIRQGPDNSGLSSYLASMNRVTRALSDLKATKMKSNQQALSDLSRLIQFGNQQLESVFKRILQEDAAPVEPLNFITKQKPWPTLSQEKTTRLGLINSFVGARQQTSMVASATESPTAKIYANVRGPYLQASLANLASASVNTAKKKSADAIYKHGTNGIGMYAQAIEGAYIAEHENVCALFARDDWGRVFNLTCQGAMDDVGRTLRELNVHIRAHLPTDCFLAYEILEIISQLSNRVETQTGELKGSFGSVLKPIRDTARTSLAELLDDTKKRVGGIQNIPLDVPPLPITTETMARLQTMVEFLRPISGIMISLGDGNWKSASGANPPADAIPSLASFDVTADGKELFAHYSADTVDALLSSLQAKGAQLLKTKQLQGVFLANNLVVVNRMISSSELAPLLKSRIPSLDTWKKKATSLYMDPWLETSRILMDVVHTGGNRTGGARGGRPPSGSTGNESAAVVKALSSKERDTIKEKFRQFNATFDELVAKHKMLTMEKEVREAFARDVQAMVEPLYGRFWDRYHELDRGRGKYVKYDRGAVAAICAGLA
ncbi:hypothetical protein V495_06683 [Pseudogymnoascus sp. VKM F-4514 (FW-929)]|nr:hypothetical protein V495_06683 [Pseudogymnoascus sp. VKM F-4514 (FW-929)]KFY60857.1 hypothetical protein V497_03340 [Pseudogymnoascus sp. VKM F-4516 (FW-969)]